MTRVLMTNNDKQALHGKRNKNDDWKRKTVGHITLPHVDHNPKNR